MIELNKEILNELNNLECDQKMKEFLRKTLELELDLVEAGKKNAPKDYKKLIADHAK